MPKVLNRAQWMKYLDPETTVVKTYIPGSHDASAYKFGNTFADFTNDLVGAITQIGNYSDQLSAGSRYFDMRLRVDGLTPRMHHNLMFFDSLEHVLKQIYDFMLINKSEFIFMDFDFDDFPGVGQKVMDALIAQFGEKKFISKHLLKDSLGNYSFNTSLKWKDLISDSDKRIFCFWPDKAKAVKDWAQPAGFCRYNDDGEGVGDFADMHPQQIVKYLQDQLDKWTYDKLFVTQLINTPKFSPSESPSFKEREARPVFNGWIASKVKGNKLGIVKRDFVSAGYQATAMAEVILLNDWKDGKAPEIDEGNPIRYQEYIRLRASNGMWVSLQTDTAGQSGLLTLIKEPDGTCNLYPREYGYGSKDFMRYSGNIKADHPTDHGNVRLLARVGDKCLSVDTHNGNRIYWGVGWGPADNLESVLFYDSHHLNNDGQIHEGQMVFVRSFYNRLFWKVTVDNKRKVGIAAIGAPETYDGEMFTIHKVSRAIL